MKSIYLDFAAATPMDKRVLAAMEPYYSENFYNPSAIYLAGKAAKRALDEAHSGVAAHLGARPGEIIFTAGATEANNLAISGLVSQYPDGEVLVSAIEHESVIEPARQFKCAQIPVSAQAIVDTARLEKLISTKTVLISVMMVNNEVGSLQPLREVSQLVKRLNQERRREGNKRPLYLHTDAAQAPSYFDLHTSRLGVDMLTINGSKIYGPKQSGALFVRAGITLRPLILGGGQERGLRSGTENVAGIIGLARALDLAAAGRVEEAARLKQLRGFFTEAVLEQLPGTVLNGSAKHTAPHIAHFSFPAQDNERLMMRLDEAGVQVAVGSACSASKNEPSHVLAAIGLSEDLARSSLRFSFGRGTTKTELEKTINLLRQFIGG